MDDNSQNHQLGGQLPTETVERVGQNPHVGSPDTGNATSHFSGQGIQLTGPGDFNVGGNVNITTNNAAPTTAAKDCRRSLFITDPSEDRAALKRKKGNRAAGTCGWILETEELTAWLGQGQTSNVLWLYGNPGTGKSTMAIFLTEELTTMFSKMDDKTLVYFFCDSSFDKQKTATSILRGLLLQLVQQHQQLLEYILPKYNEQGAGLFKSFDALWTIFMAAAADQNTGQKYCIIDALDECDSESQKILLQQFQETFQIQNAPPNIRILVTSRPYSEIYEYLNQFANKNLASFPQAEKDINLCIEEKVADLVKKKRYTTKVRQQVINILRDKAESTFLWVGLACEELREIPSKDAVKVLRDMPKGLHSLYKALLETVQKESEADIIRRILGFVAVCMWPLSILELSEVCQLYEEEEDIETRVQFTREQIASCRLMIIIQDEKVLLLHQSVKDFLVGTTPDYFINELEVHANLAYRCVNILMQEFYGRKRPNIHFFSYAVHGWPEHARMAQSRFGVRDSEAEFFQVESPSRQHWLEILFDFLGGNNNVDNRHISEAYGPLQHMSILQIAAQWGISSLVDYITSQYCQESNTKNPIPPILLDCIDSDDATPIELAVKVGHISVTSQLLCLGAKVTERVIKAAAANSIYGEEVMALLLDRRGDQITITEDVAEVAAANTCKEVMALLLDRRGGQITITKNIIKAAAKNYHKGVMELLFDRRGDQIKITKSIVKVAATYSTKEVILLLFDRRGSEITITDEVVMAAAKNFDKEAVILFLDRRGNDISITAKVIRALAKNLSCGKEVMMFLLDQRKDIISFTKELTLSIVRRFDEEILTLLFEKCRDKVSMTEEVVEAVIQNYRTGEDIMALLLHRWGNEITITEEMLKEAAGKGMKGKEILTLLFDHRGDEVVVTEEVLKAAARNESDSKVMMFLLSQQGNKVAITKEVIKTAVSNYDIGEELMALLLDERGNEITITEELLEAAARNTRKGKEIITLLFNRRGNEITITENVISAVAAVLDEKMMEMLLNQRDNEIAITETALVAAAENLSHGREVISLLLSQRSSKITITEKVLEAAARNTKTGREVMSLLLSQREHLVTITEEVVKLAAKNSVEVIELLLDHRGNEITVTEDVLKAAINWHTDTKVITFLLNQQDHEIVITEGVVKTAAESIRWAEEIITLFLSQQKHQVTITEEVVKAAAGNCFGGKEVMKLLLNQGRHQVTITEEVIKAAARNRRGKKMIKLLLDQRGHQVTITEEVMKTAAKNRSDGDKIISLLLKKRGHQVAITEEVMKAAAGNSGCGKEVMILLLNQRGDQITITEDVIKTAAACGQDDILDVLSKDKSIVTNWDKWRCISKFYNAAKTGDVRCIKDLLSKGIDPDTKNLLGQTPLWIAAQYRHETVVKILAQEKGVDVNSSSNSSVSLLFWASQGGYGEVVAILMEAGADPYLVNKDGHTAITIAKKHGYSRIVKMLEHVG